MPKIRVTEVASFYSMYNSQPVGKNLIQVCRTSPCWLRGSDKITDTICKEAKWELMKRVKIIYLLLLKLSV